MQDLVLKLNGFLFVLRLNADAAIMAATVAAALGLAAFLASP